MAHRFRRSIILVATLAASLLIVSPAGRAQTVPQPPPPAGPAHPMTADPADQPYFTLTWRPDPRAAAIDRLTRHNSSTPLPRLTPGQLIANPANLDHHADRRCGEATQAAGAVHPPMARPADWYCLDREDSTSTSWSLQGITGSEDAHNSGRVDRRNVFLMSWYHNNSAGVTDRSRLSMLVPSLNSDYVNIELVRLTGTAANPSFRGLPTHADGVVWYGNHLYVADPSRGLLVFDMDDILDLGTTTDPRAPGYRFVLPETGAWRTQGTPCNRTLPPGQTGFVPRKQFPCYNYASLDRSATSYQFVTGEYCRLRINDVPSWCDSRLARWRIDDIESRVPGRTISAAEVFTQPATSVQGAASYSFTGTRACYYFNSSRGGNRLGWVFSDVPNRNPNYQPGGVGLQDLYVARIERQLWTVTEWPGVGKRILYGINPPPCP